MDAYCDRVHNIHDSWFIILYDGLVPVNKTVFDMRIKCSAGVFVLMALISGLLTACTRETGKFVKLDPGKTNIGFTNNITESDSVNIFDFANIYNGGGVGVGDFNNDGL